MLIPISAPKPNSKPSLNLVLAFQNTAALSTPAMEPPRGRAVGRHDRVAVAGSVAVDDRDGLVERADDPDRTTRSRNSAVKSAAEAGCGDARRREHGPLRPRSHRSSTPLGGQRRAHPGQERPGARPGARAAARRRCRPRAAGSLALTTIDSAIAGSAARSRYTKQTPV